MWHLSSHRLKKRPSKKGGGKHANACFCGASSDFIARAIPFGSSVHEAGSHRRRKPGTLLGSILAAEAVKPSRSLAR